MERQRLQAIEALDISGNCVKCQRCGMAIPIVVGKLARPYNVRIAILQKRIKWIEHYRRSNANAKDENLKVLKAELAVPPSSFTCIPCCTYLSHADAAPYRSCLWFRRLRLGPLPLHYNLRLHALDQRKRAYFHDARS
jgi:hypothetical protein